jgi:transcriptional regulator with XRE-family HTH domain
MNVRVDRIRAVREQLGWSQRELGRITGLGDTQISRYEGGRTEPSAENLGIIAEKLDVSVDYLLGRTDDPRGMYGDGVITEEEQEMLQAYRSKGWLGVLRLVTDHLSK